ncbi:uncharacterized protein RAG0_11684 [Rhynchosporium agropyri]|uniref:Uncharacterized protein n=1 Tax=Rhynchosporium agropyri TaxID=914238 RepID=A0A1E1L5A4_9HELO|nr:uncharacterized protein RAG0_11684 [Rhynchosporium agropyri]
MSRQGRLLSGAVSQAQTSPGNNLSVTTFISDGKQLQVYVLEFSNISNLPHLGLLRLTRTSAFAGAIPRADNALLRIITRSLEILIRETLCDLFCSHNTENDDHKCENSRESHDAEDNRNPIIDIFDVGHF